MDGVSSFVDRDVGSVSCHSQLSKPLHLRVLFLSANACSFAPLFLSIEYVPESLVFTFGSRARWSMHAHATLRRGAAADLAHLPATPQTTKDVATMCLVQPGPGAHGTSEAAR
jgi:hypothetical protein